MKYIHHTRHGRRQHRYGWFHRSCSERRDRTRGEHGVAWSSIVNDGSCNIKSYSEHAGFSVDEADQTTNELNPLDAYT